MTNKYKPHETVYVVLRANDYSIAIEDRVYVKEVLRSAEIAEREVARLNKLNADKGAKYWWTSARLFPEGKSHGPDEED